MMCSALALTVGNNQGMGGVELGKIYGISFPPEFLRLRWPVLQHHGHGGRERLRHQ